MRSTSEAVRAETPIIRQRELDLRLLRFSDFSGYVVHGFTLPISFRSFAHGRDEVQEEGQDAPPRRQFHAKGDENQPGTEGRGQTDEAQCP